MVCRMNFAVRVFLQLVDPARRHPNCLAEVLHYGPEALAKGEPKASSPRALPPNVTKMPAGGRVWDKVRGKVLVPLSSSHSRKFASIRGKISKALNPPSQAALPERTAQTS